MKHGQQTPIDNRDLILSLIADHPGISRPQLTNEFRDSNGVVSRSLSISLGLMIKDGTLIEDAEGAIRVAATPRPLNSAGSKPASGAKNAHFDSPSIAPVCEKPARLLSDLERRNQFSGEISVVLSRSFSRLLRVGTADDFDLNGFQPWSIPRGAKFQALEGDFTPEIGDTVIKKGKYLVVTVSGKGDTATDLFFMPDAGRLLVARWVFEE